jgi:hypothetical protein
MAILVLRALGGIAGAGASQQFAEGALQDMSPKVRYRIWLSASLKFLVPLALLVSLGNLVKLPAQRAVSLPTPAFTNTLAQNRRAVLANALLHRSSAGRGQRRFIDASMQAS